MNDVMEADVLLSVSDAARIANVSPDCIRIAERQGRLHATRTMGGIRLFRLETVRQFAAERSRRRMEPTRHDELA